jgi:hypothetical protein
MISGAAHATTTFRSWTRSARQERAWPTDRRHVSSVARFTVADLRRVTGIGRRLARSHDWLTLGRSHWPLQAPVGGCGRRVTAEGGSGDGLVYVAAKGGMGALDAGDGVVDAGAHRLAGPLGLVAQVAGAAAKTDRPGQVLQERLPLDAGVVDPVRVVVGVGLVEFGLQLDPACPGRRPGPARPGPSLAGRAVSRCRCSRLRLAQATAPSRCCRSTAARRCAAASSGHPRAAASRPRLLELTCLPDERAGATLLRPASQLKQARPWATRRPPEPDWKWARRPADRPTP